MNKENKNIIEKICKILALKESSFAHEAEAAILKARELMAKYDLQESDLEESDDENIIVDVDIDDAKRRVFDKGTLSALIAEAFRCLSYERKYFCSKSLKWEKVIKFIGREKDVLIAKHTYLFCVGLIKYNIKIMHQNKKTAILKQAHINTYAKGFMIGLKARFDEQNKSQEYGLVLVMDEEVKDFIKKRKIGAAENRGRKTEYSESDYFLRKGYVDGRDADNNNCLTER